jgi:hypothetical protein
MKPPLVNNQLLINRSAHHGEIANTTAPSLKKPRLLLRRLKVFLRKATVFLKDKKFSFEAIKPFLENAKLALETTKLALESAILSLLFMGSLVALVQDSFHYNDFVRTLMLLAEILR